MLKTRFGMRTFPPRSGHRPGDPQRAALLHARQQRHALPLLRGRRAGRQAVAGGVGPAAAQGVPRHALELASLLHRLSARVLVSHRRRGRLPDPGRVPHLEHEPQARRFRRRRAGRGSTPSGCRSDGTTRASSSGTPATRRPRRRPARRSGKVRGLDFSNRPWDNGYSPAVDPGDSSEQHPVPLLQSDYPPCEHLAGDPGTLGWKPGKNAIIVNEYGWLWLNRDGTPTTLTKRTLPEPAGPEFDDRPAAPPLRRATWPPRRNSGDRTAPAPACCTSAAWAIRGRTARPAITGPTSRSSPGSPSSSPTSATPSLRWES